MSLKKRNLIKQPEFKNVNNKEFFNIIITYPVYLDLISIIHYKKSEELERNVFRACAK